MILVVGRVVRRHDPAVPWPRSSRKNDASPGSAARPSRGTARPAPSRSRGGRNRRRRLPGPNTESILSAKRQAMVSRLVLPVMRWWATAAWKRWPAQYSSWPSPVLPTLLGLDDRVVRVEVAVWLLRLREQLDGLVGHARQARDRPIAQVVGDGFQPLVDVGVKERSRLLYAPCASRRPDAGCGSCRPCPASRSRGAG